MPLPSLPFKLSPAEADALIEVFDDYLAAFIVAAGSDAIEDAVDLNKARERLKARLVAGDEHADADADADADAWVHAGGPER